MKPILHWSACAASAGAGTSGKEQGRVSFPTESHRRAQGRSFGRRGTSSDWAYPPLALFFRSLASFSISSVFLTMRTENTSVVVVFWSSSRSWPVSW